MKLSIVVQARNGSTRLPEKITRPFHNGQTILDILLQNLRKNKFEIPVILATSTAPENDSLEFIAGRHGVAVYRGEENNVLKRFTDCASEFGLTHIIRICSDNPFLNIGLLDELIDRFIKEDSSDYMSYRNAEGTPAIKTHLGLFAEIASVKALNAVFEETEDPFFYEHVTLFLYSESPNKKVNFLEMPQGIKERNDIRMTIDTEADFNLMQDIYDKVNNPQDINELLAYIDSQPFVGQLMRQNILKNSK